MRICELGADGEGVSVSVGAGVGVSVGDGVIEGVRVRLGTALGVPARFVAMAACPVSTTTVGKYSGGYGVGALAAAVGAQAGRGPRREAIRRRVGSLIFFIQQKTPYYNPALQAYPVGRDKQGVSILVLQIHLN
jgi:hypothetical protein